LPNGNRKILHIYICGIIDGDQGEGGSLSQGAIFTDHDWLIFRQRTGRQSMNLYVSDLDGTLLRNDATLSDYSRKTLNKLIRNGLAFTVASARSVEAMQILLKDVSLQLPVIEINGAYISDFTTGEHLITNQIEKSMAEELYRLFEKYRYHPFITSNDLQADYISYSNIKNEGMKWFYQDLIRIKDKRLRNITHLKDALNERIICFTLIERKEVLIDLVYAIEEKFTDRLQLDFFENHYSPGWYWLTIHDRKATKGEAIKELVKQFHFVPEKVTVFGDGENDINMFRYAKHAIAVSNASETLKKHASKVIGSNEEDSVVTYIKERNEKA